MDSTESITFEVLTPKDEQRVHDLCRDIYLEMGWPIELLEPTIGDSFNQSGDVFIVIKQKGEIIGCGGLQRLSEREVLMKKFYLIEQVRGSGLALKLFNELVSRARAFGYSSLVLDVSSNNLRAIHFYQKQNMEEFAVSPHPRWEESSVEKQKIHRYFRMKL